MATATSIHAAHRNQIEIPPHPPSRRLLPRPAAASATYNSLRAAIKRHSRKLDTMKAGSSSSSSGAGTFGYPSPRAPPRCKPRRWMRSGGVRGGIPPPADPGFGAALELEPLACDTTIVVVAAAGAGDTPVAAGRRRPHGGYLFLSFSVLAIVDQLVNFPLLLFTIRPDALEHATMYLHLVVYASVALTADGCCVFPPWWRAGAARGRSGRARRVGVRPGAIPLLPLPRRLGDKQTNTSAPRTNGTGKNA
ncbi:hypothetical protein OsI_27562 [Oryza sativa Indica Group]|uniref:Uncharacterized protein n=1 Tax=Oryza sativa subsp. indica TaxID=39946 RepID=A2YQJ7_ORYSI|nr:hypothetical protein OsI_27562 [Oryza sativa Indica Group]